MLTELSAIFQIAAALAAFWQIKRSGKRLAWGLIAAALLVLAGERFRTLVWGHVVTQETQQIHTEREFLMLVVSVLLFFGVWLIGGLFEQARDDAAEATRNKDRIQAILDSLPVGAFSFDRDLRVTSCNPTMGDIIGVPADEILGMDLSTIGDERVIRIFRETLAGKKQEGTGEYRSVLSGRKLFGMIVTIPDRDPAGVVIGGLGFVVNLTEIRQAEEEVRRLANVVDRSSEAICMLDADWNIRFANASASRLSGYAEGELVGRPTQSLQTEEGLEAYREMVETVTSGSSWMGKLTLRRKDGSYIEVESLVFSLRDQNQGEESIEFVAFNRDLTDRVELERRVQQMEKMETVGQLAGGIAHDFNNVLTAILTTVELLQQRGDEVDLDHSLKVIHDAGEHAAQLTRQLLAFSRKQHIRPVDLDLNRAISRDLPMIRRLIGENISIEFVEGGGLATVHTDPGQLSQVLINLCANARDAMPQGGTITIETKNVVLNGEFVASHPWAKPGQYVLLTVSDTGHGMDEATLKRVFEPFFTTKPEGRGTGLGLASVYGIIKQHDGLIHAYSEPEQGTSYKIYLPAVERRAMEFPAETEAPAVGGDETLLLVEDDEGVREALASTLRTMGYRVTTAEDGVAGLAALETLADDVHLVISDTVMPRMGGVELAQAVAERHPNLPFLLLSGYAKDAVFKNKPRPDHLEFLQKPFGVDTLLRTLRQILGPTTP